MTPANLGRSLQDLADSVDAPDVVLACSRDGHRTVATSGTAPESPSHPRQTLRYEIGSATKTFTGLLLAHLAEQRIVRLSDPVRAHLPLTAPPHRHRDAITLLHLITHTSGLPRLPAGFYRQGLPNWRSNPYANYASDRLLGAFARRRPRRPPGRRWRYSNFGVALLGPALGHTTATPFHRLLTDHLLAPLALTGTTLQQGATGGRREPAGGPAVHDAVGHLRDQRQRLPAFDAGGCYAAGAVRATPADLLSYLEAHLQPPPGPLGAALHAVREPRVRHRFGHHTLTWFQRPTPDGPVFFHGGATPGQEAFLGYAPDTGTAVVALATRRHHRAGRLGDIAYDLLATPGHPALRGP
ncbi:serine hydrolase domain-containing protein [Streptomyces sp. B6B3]|uniref:serine hydrolase domain-containing protein n=1 Tax=Streptomyces sp. B6B3 TaxID=3153570 RepID=UPI00325E0D06